MVEGDWEALYIACAHTGTHTHTHAKNKRRKENYRVLTGVTWESQLPPATVCYQPHLAMSTSRTCTLLSCYRGSLGGPGFTIRNCSEEAVVRKKVKAYNTFQMSPLCWFE